jgi:hypothetical protein
MLALAGIAACGGDDPSVAMRPSPYAQPEQCSSGILRDPNESEGPLMMPGYACTKCHADFNSATGDAAPLFRFAGTVYPTGHEPDGCVGAGGPPLPEGGNPLREPERDPDAARIVVTDAAGVMFGAQVNRGGNFMLDAQLPVLKLPYTAKIVYQGRVRQMLKPQKDGDCNVCHTQEGVDDTPGRIVLP